MGKVKGVLYRFQDCQCPNIYGGLDTIPAGLYWVAELDVVSVAVGPRKLDLEKNAFNLLKADGKATHMP
ncbi:hypothetical protein D3C81_1130850 [compost metagenome]